MNWESIWTMDWWLTLRHETWDSTVLHVFFVVLTAALVDFFARRIVHRVEAHIATKTDNPIDDALFQALPAPLSVVIWVVGLRVASLLIGGPILNHPKAAQLFSISLIAAAAWFFVRWIHRTEELMVVAQAGKPRDEQIDATTVHAVGKLLRLSVIITGILVSLETWEIDVSAVLAFGGIGGLAIGFAAKDLLSNFFGGLMLYMDQPFKVGDWVRSPDRDIEGTVEYIGWRLTRIRTFDKRPLYVPNAIFTSIAIENPQRMLNRRIYETIGIRYDDVSKMDAITKDVEQMLKTHPEIDTSQILMVYFNAFAASSCDFFVYTFTKTTEWAYYHKVKHDVLLKIASIIEGHGAEIAYPTSTIHLQQPPPPTGG